MIDIETDIQLVRRLVENGGPGEADYPDLDAWIAQIHRRMSAGEIGAEDIHSIRKALGRALSPATMQGFAYSKPHGYAGDYEIIDRIYARHISSDPALANWDRYYHRQAATQAVRNRKAYFHSLLDAHSKRRQPLRVLKIASGPGRSMFEWLSANRDADVTFQCVELDPRAIAFAEKLNAPFGDKVSFTQKNVLRYHPQGPFDIIWAAGIFDYFSDALFTSLVRRLWPAVAIGGELVIGNFSDRNPSRSYMELIGDWNLHHRSASRLQTLAHAAGIPQRCVTVGQEAEGVNLFLHLSSLDLF